MIKILSINELKFLTVLVLALMTVSVCANNKESHHLKVLTYNVNYGNPNQSLIKIIDTLNADVVCLQETNMSWESLVQGSLLKKKYKYIEFKHCCNAGGLAILSKYPIIKEEYIDNGIGWFPAWLFTIKTSQTNIQLLNVHLKPGINEKGKVGFLAREFFRAQKTHISELKHFMQSLDKQLPTLILGDFNENDNGKAMKWLRKKKGYEDSLSQYDKKSKTWRWGILRGRYDHILLNNQLICNNSEVFEWGISDHLPVIGEYEITSHNKK